ncbi:MAG: TadE/TadG family type IV pilus assembly protein [Planctomycetota bacterium]
MDRTVLIACLPWLGILLAACLAAWLLVHLHGYRARWQHVWRLHRDEDGAVQSLSFVLTLPVFIMLVMLIVQVSQLMIGTVIVHYAAYATARAATVWIPADLRQVSLEEGPNRISRFQYDPEVAQQIPQWNELAPDYGPSDGGVTLLVDPDYPSPKFDRIRRAAILACMPAAPSWEVLLGSSVPAGLPTDSIQRLYAAVSPDSTSNQRINPRLENKLRYAAARTNVELRVYHPNIEPPLQISKGRPYLIPPDVDEFAENEIGWQDLITVTVYHDLALLPGPGRLLAGRAERPGGGRDEVAEAIERRGDQYVGSDGNVTDSVYVYPLKASVTIGNEGDKPLVPYAHARN